MKIRRIRVFERGEICVGEQGLKARDLALLARFEEERRLGAFEIGWNKLRLKEHVGVFAAGDLVLEILPKAEPPERREDAGLERKWSYALRRMLEVAYDLTLEASGTDSLDATEESLLDVFARHYLNLVQELIRSGLAKGYHRVRERQSGIRGKVIAGNIGAEALVHQERLLCEYEAYDRDIPHNQLLALAVRALTRLPLTLETVERARRLSDALPETDLFRVSPESFAALSWDRRTTAYKPAMDLARLILLGLSPEQRRGETQAVAILFAMNDLFESYIAARLRTAARSRGWKVSLQVSRLFWERTTIRPDIILEGHSCKIILDTKWKVLSVAKPSMEDLRQMYVYDRYFGAERAYLVYPEIYGFGLREGSYRGEGQGLSCGLLFIDLFDGERLAKDVGNTILDRLEYDAAPPLPFPVVQC